MYWYHALCEKHFHFCYYFVYRISDRWIKLNHDLLFPACAMCIFFVQYSFRIRVEISNWFSSIFTTAEAFFYSASTLLEFLSSFYLPFPLLSLIMDWIFNNRSEITFQIINWILLVLLTLCNRFSKRANGKICFCRNIQLNNDQAQCLFAFLCFCYHTELEQKCLIDRIPLYSNIPEWH